MVVSVVGVTGSIDAVEWPSLARRMAQAQGDELLTGLAVTPGTGRNVVVSAAGDAYQVGTLLTTNASVTVPIGTNTSGLSRIDTIVAQVDWFDAAGLPTSEATAGSIINIQGQPNANPVPFALKKNPGDLWQTAIKYVLVRNAFASFVAADLTNPGNGVMPERTCSGSVTLSSGGTAPSSVDVLFPPGFFTKTPEVVLSHSTGAAVGTVSTLWANARSKTGFTANIARTTVTDTVVQWIASGN